MFSPCQPPPAQMEQSAGQKLITHKQIHQPEESRRAASAKRSSAAEVEPGTGLNIDYKEQIRAISPEVQDRTYMHAENRNEVRKNYI